MNIGDYVEVCSPVDGMRWRGEGRIAEIKDGYVRVGARWFPARNVRRVAGKEEAKHGR